MICYRDGSPRQEFQAIATDFLVAFMGLVGVQTHSTTKKPKQSQKLYRQAAARGFYIGAKQSKHGETLAVDFTSFRWLI